MEESPSAAATPRPLPLVASGDLSPATVRPRAEDDSDEGPPAKRTPECKAMVALGSSPTKLKAIARKTLKLPPLILQSTLPKYQDVTAANLLAWHAGCLVLHHDLKEKRVRRSSKAPLDTESIIVTCAAAPDHPGGDRTRSWQERQSIKHNAARLFSKVFQMTAVQGRTAWQPIWANAPEAVRANWGRLLEAEGYEKLVQEAEPPSDEPEDGSHVVECHGAMLTWQSLLGRSDDPVRCWLSHNIGRDVLVELMQGDEICKSVFKTFCSFVDDLASPNGFKHFACAMELNAPDAARAVVHLHAYIAISWIQGRIPELVKGTFLQEQWQYGGYAPHVAFTKIKRNADPKKLICQGLFYCAAPKIGSVFRHCSLEPGKDGRVARFVSGTLIVSPGNSRDIPVFLCQEPGKLAYRRFLRTAIVFRAPEPPSRHWSGGVEMSSCNKLFSAPRTPLRLARCTPQKKQF